MDLFEEEAVVDEQLVSLAASVEEVSAEELAEEIRSFMSEFQIE